MQQADVYATLGLRFRGPHERESKVRQQAGQRQPALVVGGSRAPAVGGRQHSPRACGVRAGGASSHRGLDGGAASATSCNMLF